MVGVGHAAYTDRFHELARLVPHLVTLESRMIKRYVYGLAPQIRGIVAATEPKTMQKAVQISSALTDEAVRNGSIKKVEKRGNVGKTSKDKNGRDDNKRTRTGNVFATIVNHVGKENIGQLALDRIEHKNRKEIQVAVNNGGQGRGNQGNQAREHMRRFNKWDDQKKSGKPFRTRLEAHGAEVSTEDANHKFLRSLPPAWSNLAMTMRTKPDVDTLSIDNLYNNLSLRVFKQEMQDDRSSECSTCQSNDSAGSIGTSSKHSVDLESEISRPEPTSTSPNFSSERPQGSAVKTSAGYNWRLTRLNSNCNGGPTFIRTDHPLKNMVDRGIFDSGCSGHMTGNKDQLEDFEEFNGGSVTFGGSKGYITGKGRIRVGNLDFDSVSFVKELGHFNLFSISQICDKQHKVLFTETECLVVSPDFKMLDENQILLKVPR
ncbi:hypothetical protein Tco_1189092 [Tanacetum coccineum]